MSTPRIEHDTLGPVEVPHDALYGAQTARAVANFPLSGRPLPWELIRALVEIKALKTALVSYRSQYGGYPTCPKKICTPGECLFLSLAGFHNESGSLEIPPYPALVPSTIFGYDSSAYDVGEIPDFSHNDGKSLMLWLSRTLDNDVSFLDPWGNEYVYEFPREDGASGYLLFSMGPDGKTGEGHAEDDLP